MDLFRICLVVNMIKNGDLGDSSFPLLNLGNCRRKKCYESIHRTKIEIECGLSTFISGKVMGLR